MLFTSPSTFSIQDWLISHSQLLIRSAKSINDPNSENIDLIFVGVCYMDICDVLHGTEISYAKEHDVVRLKHRSEWQEGAQFFEITSNAHSYYIGAASFRVERNKLGTLESSLGDWPMTKTYIPKDSTL
jgi:hypothetical protein